MEPPATSVMAKVADSQVVSILVAEVLILEAVVVAIASEMTSEVCDKF